jgi:hypothetical protein
MSKRRIFLAYCAFAPFMHAAAAVWVHAFWGLGGDAASYAYFHMLLAIPFSAWFLLETSFLMGRKNDAIVAGNLSMLSHMAAYWYAWMGRVVWEFTGQHVSPPDDWSLVAFPLCLLASGAALLMAWDSIRRKEAEAARIPQ